MSENYRVVKAAGVVGAATLASRILGFIRDAVIAWFFGAGFSSDAFIAAFRIPNLLRRLFAEGSLSSAFIPVFMEYTVNQGQAEAFHLARSAFRLVGVVLIVVAICGVMLSPWIVRLIAPGFSADKLALTITLTRLMFPYIFFIGLVALCMGILNVLGHFATPAFAPVLLNLAIIGSALFISPSLPQPVMGLAVGVLLGGFLQLALQLPVLIKKRFYFWQASRWIHPGLKRVGTLIPPVIIGGAVYQINILVGTLLASLLEQGSVTYLYFADRLVQFPAWHIRHRNGHRRFAQSIPSSCSRRYRQAQRHIRSYAKAGFVYYDSRLGRSYRPSRAHCRIVV
jgi:putative peptidoglycan lipid II flippase